MRGETEQGAVHDESTVFLEKRLSKVEKKLEIVANPHMTKC